MNPYKVIDTAERGISINTFDKLSSQSGYSKAALAGFIGMDVRTISNYKNKKKDFKKTDAEHLLKLEGLFNRGKEVFGSNEEFARWLGKPSYGLEGRIPEKLLNYISGIELVSRELTRIEYGDFS